ncbi:MAG: FHA domain-containing protein [Clostridiales bacterium]|nr:FHA domain-containing protein [Clostridiales bacterium]
MAMQQCPNGHLFDDTKNSSCTYCGSNNQAGFTVPLGEGSAAPMGGGFPSTMPLDGFQAAAQYTQAEAEKVFPSTQPVAPSFQQTTYITNNVVNNKGVIAVMGWLVCLEGEKRGMDFKIHGEKNTIGRGFDVDINLDFDTAVSSGVNAIIAYDKRNNKFFIYQSNSKNNIYFNDQFLLTPIEIKDYDIIEIGTTKMIFRSLCNSEFAWESEE